MKKAKCCICGKEIIRDVYPETPNGTGGRPLELQICSNKSCQMQAWHNLRRSFGVTEREKREVSL